MCEHQVGVIKEALTRGSRLVYANGGVWPDLWVIAAAGGAVAAGIIAGQHTVRAARKLGSGDLDDFIARAKYRVFRTDRRVPDFRSCAAALLFFGRAGFRRRIQRTHRFCVAWT